jgi:pSer/pThr/pTyr-binding forkhead associated (FHA) protein
VTAIFDLHEGRNTIGRATDCDITVSDLLVSRYHAVITVAEKTLLEDAGSDNGIEVAGHRIRRAEIKVGTTFKIGPRIEAKLVEL